MSSLTPQTHAILGAGGVGGFVATILSQAGAHVVLLLRPAAYEKYPSTLTLASTLGELTAPVTAALRLDQPVDVLWISPKATQMASALSLVPDPSLPGLVVPLLNGVDHVSVLRSKFGRERVVPGTIAGEFERTAPGHFVHRTPFARFGFSAAGRSDLTWAADALIRFGCSASFVADELTLLWSKLVMLAPMALNTTAAGVTVGELWERPEWAKRFEAATREACAVARGYGAEVDAEATLRLLRGMPGPLRSSMQKDVAAGRPPELDAIAGPILRGGAALGIPVPVTSELAAMIAAKA